MRGQFHDRATLLVQEVSLLYIEDERETSLLGIELWLLELMKLKLVDA